MEPRLKIDSPPPDIVDSLSRLLPCHPVTATILANRGIHDPENARAFFHPTLNDLDPPFAIQDMTAAVLRIERALAAHEKIIIFGDYDVDGVTATAILFNFLQEAGADVATYLPHRVHDGYGLSPRFVDEHATALGINLIISVDNGSSSHEAVNHARAAGIDVIICDHHTITAPFPAAVAVINPKRSDCTGGFDDLAGVGVVFALLICLRKHLRDSGFWGNHREPNLKQTCDLVALGTVADLVPLRGNNRILTRTGLDLMRQKVSRPGVMALLDFAGVTVESVNSEDIAFRLAPRINAAGRLAHAKTALSLLTTQNTDDATKLAERIEGLNRQRRKIQTNLIDEIQAGLEADTTLSQRRALVLWGKDWHEGVLGIVAAQLSRQYHRPVVLISTRNGIGKGSARSIPEFDLHAGLTACHDVLTSYGGHALAAGMTVEVKRLNDFRNRFETVVQKTIGETLLAPTIQIDCEISFDEISDQLLDELELLSPFGNTNPEPLFLARNVEITSWKIVGQTHLSMRLRQPSGASDQTIQAMQFNIDPRQKVSRFIKTMVFRVGWNRWHQRRAARIIIESV